ncbi:NADH:ubiquinone dehydrogenase subunit 5 [Datura stramonium]|uniref:NADH:ubiquinone dehydrogenase subunit 5 n=1 Tax=Datura stramonium TaxID=4076 RepID=A0ABS8STN0_DATST|nr:NADH:ubiquinone dehydrogenase subunit 5 [Datura stramonium]
MDGFLCPSLANASPQRHSVSSPLPFSLSLSTAGKAAVETKPIATPTIKYEIGPLLKDLMEWPTPPKSAYVIGELMWLETTLRFVLISGLGPQNLCKMSSGLGDRADVVSRKLDLMVSVWILWASRGGVEEADHERYRCGRSGQGRLRRALQACSDIRFPRKIKLIGSHTWSPDAMRVPPSIRFDSCSYYGAMTSFLAATTGILQNDLKRVIAIQSCSQLGYMDFWFGGSVIHAMSDEQDMRKMGGLASSFRFTYAMMLMGSLSLIGFPFLTGFYSKDVILELAYTKYTISGNFAFWLGSVSVLFTYYSFSFTFSNISSTN